MEIHIVKHFSYIDICVQLKYTQDISTANKSAKGELKKFLKKAASKII